MKLLWVKYEISHYNLTLMKTIDGVNCNYDKEAPDW